MVFFWPSEKSISFKKILYLLSSAYLLYAFIHLILFYHYHFYLQDKDIFQTSFIYPLNENYVTLMKTYYDNTLLIFYLYNWLRELYPLEPIEHQSKVQTSCKSYAIDVYQTEQTALEEKHPREMWCKSFKLNQ